jgi:hypothetical protein
VLRRRAEAAERSYSERVLANVPLRKATCCIGYVDFLIEVP